MGKNSMIATNSHGWWFQIKHQKKFVPVSLEKYFAKKFFSVSFIADDDDDDSPCVLSLLIAVCWLREKPCHATHSTRGRTWKLASHDPGNSTHHLSIVVGAWKVAPTLSLIFHPLLTPPPFHHHHYHTVFTLCATHTHGIKTRESIKKWEEGEEKGWKFNQAGQIEFNLVALWLNQGEGGAQIVFSLARLLPPRKRERERWHPSLTVPKSQASKLNAIIIHHKISRCVIALIHSIVRVQRGYSMPNGIKVSVDSLSVL